MCFVVIVLGKTVYVFSPLPLSKSRLAVKQPTSHAVPALTPSLLSDLITHSPQSLNLVSQNLLDRTHGAILAYQRANHVKRLKGGGPVAVLRDALIEPARQIVIQRHHHG